MAAGEIEKRRVLLDGYASEVRRDNRERRFGKSPATEKRFAEKYAVRRGVAVSSHIGRGYGGFIR